MLRVPVLAVPLDTFVPVQSPLAVHDDGLSVALQVIVELPPEVTDIGLTDMLTIGAGGGGTAVTCSATLLADPVPPALAQDRL